MNAPHSQAGQGESREQPSEKPVVNLIPDEPTGVDDFGGHQCVASALEDMIRCEPIGRSVAIEGGYGSGKSSVIKMLQRGLSRGEKDKANYHVFEFDAWHHDGDPLRLTFLRALHSDLNERGWLEKKSNAEWEKDFLHMEKSRQETVVEVNPFLTFKQSAAFILAGLAVLISTTHRLWLEALISFGIPWYWAPVLLLAVGLGCVAFAAYFFSSEGADRLKGSEVPLSKESTWPRLRRALMGLTSAFLIGRNSRTTSSVTNSRGEATSRMFEDHFRDLIKDALGQANRRLVIVMDNLDRLPPDEALRVWNTMRVFAVRDRKDEGSLNRVWLVAPFDRASLARMWDTGDSGKAKANEPSAQTDEKKAVQADSRSVALLDKVFHTRLDVPVVVLSDWRGVFERLLLKALPGSDADDREEAAAITDAHVLRNNRPPTPRELTIIVNDIGSLVRMHGRSFRLASLATYVVLRRRGMTVEEIRLDLLTPSSLDWVPIVNTEHQTIRRELACLVFGTTKQEKADGLLLRTPFVNAVRNGDGAALEQLRALPDFWHWFSTEGYSLLNEVPISTTHWRSLSAVLVDAKMLASAPGNRRRQVVHLCQKLFERSYVQTYDADAVKGITALVENIGSRIPAGVLDRVLLRADPQHLFDGEQDLLALLHLADKHDVPRPTDEIELDVELELVVPIAAMLRRPGPTGRGSHLARKLKARNGGDPNSYLSTRLVRALDESLPEELGALLELPASRMLKVDTVRDGLKTSGAGLRGGNEIVSMYRALNVISSRDAFNGLLEEVRSFWSSQFVSVRGLESPSIEVESRGYLLVESVVQRSWSVVPPGSFTKVTTLLRGLGKPTTENVEAILRSNHPDLKSGALVTSLLELGDTWHQLIVQLATASQGAESGKAAVVCLSGTSVIKHDAALLKLAEAEAFGKWFDSQLVSLSDSGEMDDAITNDGCDVAHVDLYRRVLRLHPKPVKIIRELGAWLNKLTVDHWLAALRAETNTDLLALELVGKERMAFRGSTALTEALQTYAKERVIAQKEDWKAELGVRLFTLVDDASRRSLVAELQDHIGDRTEVAEPFWEQFGQAMFGVVATEGVALVPAFARQALQSPLGVSLLAGLFSTNTDVLAEWKSDDRERFGRAAYDRSRTGLGEDETGRLLALSRAAGYTPPPEIPEIEVKPEESKEETET